MDLTTIDYIDEIEKLISEVQKGYIDAERGIATFKVDGRLCELQFKLTTDEDEFM